MESELTESALLLVCPAAQNAATSERARLDQAAKDGIPAHLTVLYPFKPVESFTAFDHRRLEEIAAAGPSFSVRFGRSGWFGDRVLYLAPEDPAPITHLTRRVWASYPDYPPYAGQFADVVPHLTVGHDHPADELERADVAVTRRLPITQWIDHLELWAGPTVEGRSSPTAWRHVRDYRLGEVPQVR